MFDLTVAAPDGRVVQRVELSERPIRIGRADDCDVRLGDARVSRHHAEVRPLDDAWVFRDLGSTHGSFVQGQRVRELTVAPGLEVRIGPAVLRFDSLAARIGAELDALLPDED